MPVNEHPLDDSWGYQPIGLFAPTRRFGDPAGFARFVDRRPRRLRSASSWTGCPRIFRPTSTAWHISTARRCTSIADPRKGFHPDWNTAIYDFGRREVANFLAASAPVLVRIVSISTDCGSMPWPRCCISIIPADPANGCRTRRRTREPATRSRFLRAGQHAVLRPAARHRHDRRGIHRLAWRIAASRQWRAWALASSGTWGGCTTPWNISRWNPCTGAGTTTS